MILESCIEGKEKYVKEVFSMQQNMPVCSLQFERFPAVGEAPAKFFVMAATANPCRYFQFIGGPDFASLFAYYQALDRQNCTELPGDLNYTELRFFAKPGEPRARSFALLTGFATYYGALYFGSQGAGEQVTADTRETRHAVAPLSIALTEFHLLSLFPRKLTVRNVLSDAVVYERESAAELRGLSPDPVTGAVWAFSDKELFLVGAGRRVERRSSRTTRTATRGSSSCRARRRASRATSRRRCGSARTTARARRCAARRPTSTSASRTSRAPPSRLRAERSAAGSTRGRSSRWRRSRCSSSTRASAAR